MLIGSHLSIAGGVELALMRAHKYGFPTLAMFVRNQRQWSAPPLSEQSVRRFRKLRRQYGIGPIVAHGSYLVNLAGGSEVRRKSIAATADELDRCGRLGIEWLNIHPGSNADAYKGIRLIADALNELISACPHRGVGILLETTSGAGYHVGGRFEELAAILARLEQGQRFGVCLDTCHVFAAGYDIRTPTAYTSTMSEFDRIIGLSRLRAVHANDSLKGLGSHLDRHVHIGMGRIGLRGFANFVNDPRLAELPLILETPKGKTPGGRDWDAVNAAALAALVRRKR